MQRFLALSLLALCATAWSQTDHQTPQALIKQTLQTRFPKIEILDVAPSPIAGVYEVYTKAGVAYSDATGSYLIEGTMIETQSMRNISEEHLDERNRIDFKTLPLEHAIKVVRGDGSRTLAVFSDPDCPYCQALEKELVKVNNITVYVFLYPLANLHPQAPAKARAIWCAQDRATAWTHWMVDGKLPEGEGKCEGVPLDDNAKLGETLQISATPTIFATDGRRASGARDQAAIEAFLKN